MSNVPAVLRVSGHGKKRILLIDSFASKRDLRAKVLRKMGIEVDCAADISEARSLWQADSYNLVLLDVKRDPRNVEEFCTEMQSAKPPQMLAFLVGKPEYLGATPCADTGIPLVDGTRNGMWSEMVASLFTNACEFLPRRYGFLEASWRIAATRSKPAAIDAVLPAGKRKHWSWTDAVQRHTPPATVEPEPGPDPETFSTANLATDKETL
jgi:CheY-like chemotaxis protein